VLVNNNLLFRCAASSLKCVPNPPVAGVVATNPRRGIHCQSDTHFPLWAANSLLCRSLNRVAYLLETPLSGCAHPCEAGHRSQAKSPSPHNVHASDSRLQERPHRAAAGSCPNKLSRKHMENTCRRKKRLTHTHTHFAFDLLSVRNLSKWEIQR
jgi:hypothetical protein